MKILVRSFFSVIILLVLGVSCSTSSDDSPEKKGEDIFDRGAVLSNLADNIIIPALQDLTTKLNDLKVKKDIFITSPDASNLENLRTSWLAAYIVWQSVEMVNIGKAEEIFYSFQMNVYPTNIVDIQANIDNGNYDLASVNNNDAVGFPALDYMLFGIGADDTEILNKYTTNVDAAKYILYVSDLVNQMNSLTETVLNDWTNSYRDTFVASTSNTASSAYNKLVNDFIFYYEKGLRANKIGIPAGNFSTDPLPEKVEAFYNKEVSGELALEALEAAQNFFRGLDYVTNTQGESFYSHLLSLEKETLSNVINDQFNGAEDIIGDLDTNFYSQVNTNNTGMTRAYDALQLNVVSLKVDMLQAFNVSVDYVDADGD